MSPRPFVLALAGLTTFAYQAAATDSLPMSPAVIPEEVVVAAPEPRYVAPTLRDRIGRVWAPVYINGQGPFRLVLDTGANRSAVIPALAKRIGAVETGPVRLHGATGTALVPTIQVESIEVGDLWLGRHQIAIVQDVFGGAEGVLGGDGLSDKRISIDFRNDEISIRRSTGRPVPGKGYTRIPVKVRHSHLLMFDVKVAGVRTRAMLDTGAQATLGNHSLREALARRAKSGSTASIVGVTLDAQDGEMLSAPPVSIADITISGMHVTFGDMYIFNAWKMTDEPAMLIGMDIIGLLDSLIIDYKRRELHLRLRR